MKACKNSSKRSVGGALVVCVLAFGASANGQVMEWVPVGSTGPATISGNEITLSAGGVQVQLEFFISGWGDAPGGPSLGAFQGTMVGTDMLGANASPPNPGVDLIHQPPVPCSLDTDCPTGNCGSFKAGFCDANQPGFQITKVCLQDPSQPCSVDAQCPGVPVCIANPAFILDGCNPATAVGLPANGNYELIAACQGPTAVVDLGTPRYAGSINFEVPADARGTYTITFNPDNQRSLLNDALGVLIPGLSLVPAQITIETGRCCFDIGRAGAGCKDNRLASECLALPFPRFFEPGWNCRSSGGPPCPECITSDPNACKDPTACQAGVDNRCTFDTCVPFPGGIAGICDNEPLFDVSKDCCLPDIGPGPSLQNLTPIDDFDDCTADVCDACTGLVTHDPAGAIGDPCDDHDICTFDEYCDGFRSKFQGGCVGSDACNADCDGDGILDVNETESAEQDCNGNGVCNGAEIASCSVSDPSCADCIVNGFPDACDIARGIAKDCNNNGVPDRCEILEGSIGPGGPFFCTGNCDPDCNNSGVPDSCDIADRSSADCNVNGIPDECDLANAAAPDCNSNGVPDECDGWACCLDLDGDSLFEACSLSTEAFCQQAGGFFRGPCNDCPTQNVAIIPEPGGGVFIHVIGAPIDCLADTEGRAAARGDCGPGVPKIDPWKSNSAAQMCHNFGVPGSPAIPADFFAPGSDPFAGTVCLVGTPLGVTAFGDFGEADTLVSRTADPFDRCSMPSASPSAVSLEVVSLSLVDDSDPVVVTFNGGQNPELWDVAVDLSTVTPSAGSLTATKTHCNGGTYTSVLNVLPRFTFTKVGDPGSVRVLDTGQAGLPPVSLIQNQSAPWVHDIDPNLGLTFDPCSDFHPGVEDALKTVDCDCDGNTLRDKCDIENLTSLDCNLNTVPDSCDLAESNSSDCNGNNVPDECELRAPAVPAAPPDDIQKNRFLSFVPNNPGCVAIKVELLDLGCSSTGKKCSSNADCKICDAGANVGEVCSRSNECPDGICVISGETCDEQSLAVQLGWVRDPFVPGGDRIPPGTFGAWVRPDMPGMRPWVEAVVHVGDCEIAPAQTYGLSATVDGETFSPRLVLGTSPKPQAKFWGDVVGFFSGTEWTPPNGFVDVNDVQAMIKFLVISKAAPHITRVDLGGEVPNWLINASDLQLVIRAFLANTYPPVAFQNKGGPADCPCLFRSCK